IPSPTCRLHARHEGTAFKLGTAHELPCREERVTTFHLETCATSLPGAGDRARLRFLQGWKSYSRPSGLLFLERSPDPGTVGFQLVALYVLACPFLHLRDAHG